MPTDPTQYKGKKIKAFPYDQNGRDSSVLILPIVSGTEIIGYLPAKATDNGDGTATLATSGGGGGGSSDVNLVSVGGTPQTSADWTPLLQNLDVDLSTRASETTLSGIKTQTDQFTFNSGRLLVEADLDASDIQIGAVELKNGTDDTRATIESDGMDNALVVKQNSQPLPTGASTEATLSTRLADATFTARINTLGQKEMSASTPVVIASDQTVIPVSDNGGSLTVDGTVAATQSGTWNINNITGTVSLPTGAATEATLATLLTLTGFQARINTLGQKTMANSTPIVIASDQSAITVASQESQASSGSATAVSVTGAATLVLAANANRKEYTIVHENASETIYVGLTSGVTTANGSPLVANQFYGSNKYTGDVYAISDGTTVSVRAIEIA